MTVTMKTNTKKSSRREKCENSAHANNLEDVKEATATLKGLLGIGIVSTKECNEVKRSEEIIENDKSISNDTGNRRRENSNKNSQKSMNGNDYNKKKHRYKKHSSSNYNRHHNSNNVSHPSSRPSTAKISSDTILINNQVQNSPAQKKSSTVREGRTASASDGKSKTNNNDSSQTSFKNNDSSSNFAWSAFQSSPDPANLPLPVFGTSSSPPLTDNGTIHSSKSFTSDKSPQKMTSVEQFEEKIIAAAEAAAAASNLKNISESSSGISLKDQNNLSNLSNQPCNKGGINLAAQLASSPSASSPDNKQLQKQENLSSTNKQVVDPVSLLLNAELTSSPSAPLDIPSTATEKHPMNQLPQIRLAPPPQLPHQHPPYHHHQHTPHLITVQVQVPPILLPGRQMIVTSPGTGYPISVAVPENVQPGMVIPVHIPAYPPPLPHRHHPSYPPPQQQQRYEHQYSTNPPPIIYQTRAPQQH